MRRRRAVHAVRAARYAGRIAIVVDDGLGTGARYRRAACLRAARRAASSPVPVASAEASPRAPHCDEVCASPRRRVSTPWDSSTATSSRSTRRVSPCAQSREGAHRVPGRAPGEPGSTLHRHSPPGFTFGQNGDANGAGALQRFQSTELYSFDEAHVELALMGIRQRLPIRRGRWTRGRMTMRSALPPGEIAAGCSSARASPGSDEAEAPPGGRR